MSTARLMHASPHSRRLLRSAVALLFGFVAVAMLSLGTDQLMHMLEIYPPWGQPMLDPALNLLAFAYRSVYAILGGFIAARLAPHAPMGHALALGIVGFALSTVGAVVAITTYDLGPDWYPVALALTAVPCSWLGGVLHGVAHSGRASLR